MEELSIVGNISESLGELSSGFKFLKNIYQKHNEKKLLKFLQGLNIEGNISEEELQKLSEYTGNDKKFEFMADVLSNILITKSKKVCFITGAILSTLLKDEQKLEGKYIICVNSLSNLFDLDIDNFTYFVNYSKGTVKGERKKRRITGWVYETETFKTLADENGADKETLMLTIEKMVNYNYLIKEYEVDFNGELDVESPNAETYPGYKLTSIGELLWEYIDKMKSINI